MKDLLRKVLPPSLWHLLQRIKAHYRGASVRKMNALGMNFIPKEDIYSPLPIWESLVKNEARWNRPSSMAGVSFDLPKMKSDLQMFIEKHYNKLTDFKDLNELHEYGVGYQQIDAVMLYCMLAEYKPKRYFEVGAGSSTYIADFARRKYADTHKTKIITIDPEPAKKLYEIADITIIKDEGQNIAVDFFDELEENDVLLIDTTHVVKIDGDVNYFILEILPRLKKGVVIHFHDISFPYNFPYPANYWITSRKVEYIDQLHWPMYWNEPLLLQAFLAYNDTFKIEMSLPLLRHHDEEFLKKVIPDYKTIEQDPNSFSGLWIRKVR